MTTPAGKIRYSYHVDGENVMKMVLRYPEATNEEEKSTKAYYADIMNYYCGFGTATKQPNWNKY